MIIDPSDLGEPTKLIVLWAPHDAHLVGRAYDLDRAIGTFRIGRNADSDIVLGSDGMSRKHARIELRADGWWVIDEKSMNGTFVNDERVTEARIRCGDRIHVGQMILKAVGKTPPFIDDSAPTHMAVDGLTRLANRRALFHAIDRELSHPERKSRRVSVAMFDIDWFKRVNDSYGHQAGDAVIVQIARWLQSRQEGSDLVARYGGEEFAWVMARTDLRHAFERAERLRAAIEARSIAFEQHAIAITVSAGVVEIGDSDVDVETVIRRVDTKLYEAKREGRNRVVR